MADHRRHVIIIGAGIIGTSIAWRLTAMNVRVTLIDAAEPGGIASPCSFGWINATYGNPRAYYELRCRSMREWEKLGADLDGLPYRRSGTVYIDFDRVDLETFRDSHSAWGYDLDWVDGEELARLEPALRDMPARALLAKREAVAEADDTARFFAVRCKADGAALVTGTKVRSLIEDGRGVTGVVTGEGPIAADEVVIAAGAATAEIARTAGVTVPLKTPPGLLVTTTPQEKLIDRLILMRGLHVRQRADGSFIAGADFGGGWVNDDPASGAKILIERIRGAIVGAEGVSLANYTIGLRPTPADGMPIVGRPSGLAGIYIAVMHSGVTLAPAVSAMAAREIVNGERDPLLQPFGHKRPM